MGSTPGLSRDNHYVPQAYLRQWAGSDGKVWTYRTLVSRPEVRPWRAHSIKGIAYTEYLYTHQSFGAMNDVMERWLAERVDRPIAEVLERVARELRLAPADWDVLLRFFAASLVRTPAHLMKRQPKWNEGLPLLMEDTARRVIENLELDKPLASANVTEEKLGGAEIDLPLRTRIRRNPSGEGGILETQIVTGRRLWLTTIHRFVSKTYKSLHSFNWTILRAPAAQTWVTSDDPAVCAHVSRELKVSSGVPLNTPGAVFVLPLSPRHMLFANAGSRPPLKYSFMERELAEFVQRCSLMNAHRYVFSQFETEWVTAARPRRVDPVAFEHDRNEWRKWNREQSQAERDLEDDSTWPS